MNLPPVSPLIPRTNWKWPQWFGLTVLKTLGWQIRGQLPEKSKFVIAVAPHTSNWDFVIGVGALLALKLRLKFLGKDAIFIWPFKGILSSLGGIPVDRKNSHGVVERMVIEFNKHEQFLLALSPEGTRSKTSEWRSGFLHIAHKAKVPVVPVSLHFDIKEVRIQPEVYIGSDITEELKKFKHNFDDACAKKPQAV